MTCANPRSHKNPDQEADSQHQNDDVYSKSRFHIVSGLGLSALVSTLLARSLSSCASGVPPLSQEGGLTQPSP